MTIALVGTGRMGQAVAAVAAERGHAVVARFDAEAPLLDAAGPEALNGAQVCVDFSDPSVGAAHVARYAEWGARAVVGTTGWTADLAALAARLEETGGAVVWAPNFSLGVALVARALGGMMPLLNRLAEYDASIHEVHHTGKLDSPSGTALRLADLILAGLDRKARTEAETVHGRIDPEALHVTSTRAGHVFGEHTVALDSPVDQIQITHRATDRRAFASGAVTAAEWVQGRTGLFTLDDVLEELGTGK